MKLYYSSTSPYVRKVMITAFETGLGDRIEKVPVKRTPIEPNDTLNRSNPLGKVPTMVTEDGLALYDSAVICEYLDSLHDGPKVFPDPGPARWTALRQQALADGLMDAGVLIRYEEALRPEALRWQAWIDGQLGKMKGALDVLEGEARELGEVTIGTISIACALGYLDLRFGYMEWRTRCPGLVEWLGGFEARRSWQATAPQE